MATRRPGKIGLWAVWFSPLVILPALLALMPWAENDWIAAVFAIYVMGYSAFVAARVNRRLDEVQIAGQRFATTHAMTIGTFAAVLVMIFPPAMNALVELANTLASTLDAGSPDKAVKVGIVFGYTLLLLLQGAGVFAVSIWWERRIYGRRT
jgi:hypothetical protein